MPALPKTVVGLDSKEVQKYLERVSRSSPDKVERALFEEAQIETTESMRKTPVDTGALRGSHICHPPKWSGREVSVKIEVGGPAAPYAVYVHEDLEAEHKVGEAKFLEKTLNESRPYLAKRVAERISRMGTFR